MTILELIARADRQHELGHITAEEFANMLSDSFASDRCLDTKDAGKVAALIPPAIRILVAKQIEIALSPGYIRQAFALGGSSRSEAEEHAAALRETFREQVWAAALKPLLS